MRKCILEEKSCIECGDCNICDLDTHKVCDNCGKCIELDMDYSSVLIDEIVSDD
ncbi:MAG: hypothetical protein KAQ68_02355 [Clostridiales bacterium]|nr:hypothetical protein [Clostridiales bacterium]